MIDEPIALLIANRLDIDTGTQPWGSLEELVHDVAHAFCLWKRPARKYLGSAIADRILQLSLGAQDWQEIMALATELAVLRTMKVSVPASVIVTAATRNMNVFKARPAYVLGRVEYLLTCNSTWDRAFKVIDFLQSQIKLAVIDGAVIEAATASEVPSL